MLCSTNCIITVTGTCPKVYANLSYSNYMEFNLNQIPRALVIFGFGFLIMMSMNCLTGLIMFARYYLCDPVKAGVINITKNKYT